jgi:hypothetical protein
MRDVGESDGLDHLKSSKDPRDPKWLRRVTVYSHVGTGGFGGDSCQQTSGTISSLHVMQRSRQSQWLLQRQVTHRIVHLNGGMGLSDRAPNMI